MKKILAIFLLAIFVISALPCVSPGFAVNGQMSASVVKAEQRWGRDRTPPTVEILSPADGKTVSGIITISATATDNVRVKKVEYRVDTGTWIAMSYVGDSTYKAEWDTTSVYDGVHTITVKATDTSNNVGEDSITVTTDNGITPPPPTMEYELFIEIDYMEGHEPTDTVLAYIQSYYYERGINVTFYVNDIVPYDPSVTDAEFWAIEAKYNNMGDDKYTGVLANFISKWKWVLYGTTVEGYPNVVGYTYVVIARVGRTYDLLAGNYIYIADGTADSWANKNGIQAYGAEAVVLMHEMGHSIGIAKLSSRGAEIYDPDSRSVMSYLSTANAKLYWAWYYSKEYWATRNMEYYMV
jgi:hypothetical protein